MDGNSVNRRLIKIHDPSKELLHKVRNPFADDDRPFFFSLTLLTSSKLQEIAGHPSTDIFGYVSLYNCIIALQIMQK